MAPNTVDDDLDTSLIGAFQADKIDHVERTKVKKMINCMSIYSRGYLLPEQGTWHLDRKRSVLRDHPEVKSLYGQNIFTIVVLFVAFILHIYYAYHFSNYSWITVIIGGYTVSAWISFVLQVVGHEGTHRLVSKNNTINRLVTLTAFLPIFNGPFGTFWMYEHMWHHNVVVDKSLRYGPQSNTPVKKALFTFFFIAIVNLLLTVSSSILGITMFITLILGLIGLRTSKYPKTFPLPPYKRFPQTLNGWTFINIITCVFFNVFIIYFTGIKGFAYLSIGSYTMNGLHPLGMRQVQEHYFVKRGQPTYSVYPYCSYLTMNIGHHVEHHDFPTIPWNRLPYLKRLAPEYYIKDLFAYNNYFQILLEFLCNKGIPLSCLFDVDIQTPQGIIKPQES